MEEFNSYLSSYVVFCVADVLFVSNSITCERKFKCLLKYGSNTGLVCSHFITDFLERLVTWIGGLGRGGHKADRQITFIPQAKTLK